jgi:hypothetical protein
MEQIETTCEQTAPTSTATTKQNSKIIEVKATRARTASKIFQKKYKTFAFTDEWLKVMGTPETTGIWLVYGIEKNGKTWFSLKLAEYLTDFEKVLYISAEEGMSLSIKETLQRVKFDIGNRRLLFMEYIPIEELDQLLSKKQAPKIVFLDNLTIYADELKNGIFRKLVAKHHDKLFVCVAHEERNEPYTAVAKLASKLAKIKVRVKGLACMVSGRCPGGTLTIDEEKAALYWGQNIVNN